MRAPFALVLVAFTACRAADVPSGTHPDAGGPGAPVDGPLELAGNVTSDSTPAGRLAAPRKVLLTWDVPGVDGSAYKFGEGTLGAGKLTLRVPGAPPDAVITDGAIAVANLVVVASDQLVPDGPLTSDAADALLQTALGVADGVTVVYKLNESEKYPWLTAFPPGLSCGQAQAASPGARRAGDLPVNGLTPVPCSTLPVAVAEVSETAFANWYWRDATVEAAPALARDVQQ